MHFSLIYGMNYEKKELESLLKVSVNLDNFSVLIQAPPELDFSCQSFVLDTVTSRFSLEMCVRSSPPWRCFLHPARSSPRECLWSLSSSAQGSSWSRERLRCGSPGEEAPDPSES